jgi:hypothetical protein
MADGCGHAADLAVLALKQLQGNPTGRHGFAEADGRVARGNIRLRLQQPGPAGQGVVFLNNQSLAELEQFGLGGDALHLDPVFALVSITGVQQPFVQARFVAEQEQAFGVGIEAANGIDVPGEMEFGQGAMGDPSGVNWERTPYGFWNAMSMAETRI